MHFLINGKNKLNGEIKLAGAKNAATKMMVASLLTDEPCYLINFPQIGDTKITGELCEIMGGQIKISGMFSSVEARTSIFEIRTSEIKSFKATSQTRRNRIPILTLGPLLNRIGEAEIPFLGGDKIGARPVDIHLESFIQMGANVEKTDGGYHVSAQNGLHGARLFLRYPSVGATENIILAAVLAKGQTIIQNAAIEPEVQDLIKMLQKMGAIIGLGANRMIFIDGVQKLKGVAHEIMPDRNEAVSFGTLAVATDGKIFVRNAVQEHLITFLNSIRKVGGEYCVEKDGIWFWREHELRPIHIETDTHPSFMTDWQQPFVVLLTQANGVSTVHETVFEDRFGYTKDLNTMGAKIKISTDCVAENLCRYAGKNFMHSAIIEGYTPLHKQNLKIPDLRAGIAHVIAALIADGGSEISNIEELDRGYENIDIRLKNLGPDIRREA